MNDELAKIIRNRNIKDLTKYYYNGIPVDGVDHDGNNILHLAAKVRFFFSIFIYCSFLDEQRRHSEGRVATFRTYPPIFDEEKQSRTFASRRKLLARNLVCFLYFYRCVYILLQKL